jgi:NitT/TauT family transport system permease protein
MSLDTTPSATDRPTRTEGAHPAVHTTRGTIVAARRRRRLLVHSLQLLVALIAITAWQYASGPRGESSTLVDEFYVSNPTDIWAALVDQITGGTLAANVLVTAQETIYGFLLGAVLGLLVGFALGTNELASAVIRPYVVALNSVPRLALVPLFILWFGLGMTSKVAFVAMIVFFLVFYNTYAGVQDVDRQLVDVLRIMGAKRRQIHRRVTVPSAMTWIIAGLSISVPYALVAAVTAEIVSSNSGVGFMLNQAAGQFYTAGVFASILVLVVMGLLLTGIVTLLERRLLGWKASTK